MRYAAKHKETGLVNHFDRIDERDYFKRLIAKGGQAKKWTFYRIHEAAELREERLRLRALLVRARDNLARTCPHHLIAEIDAALARRSKDPA